MGEVRRIGEGLTVCFFCQTDDPAAIERNEFYRVDLQILRDLGFKVVVTTTFKKIPEADLYFIWWWTWAAFPLLKAKLTRKPAVIVGTFDHVLPDGRFEYFPARNPIHQAMIRWSLKAADANVVVSMDQLKRMSESFKVRNLTYSPHVIDTEFYRPGHAPREEFFLTICWMHHDNARRKCVATTIRAMTRLHPQYPGYKLLIAGDKGSAYPELEALVRELGAEEFVIFLGAVSQEEKLRLLQTCAVYLQPTLAEGFGVAILEAMSCGCAIITSHVGAVPEVVGDQAVFVTGNDPNQLSQSVGNLLTDKDALAELRRNGRDRAVALFSYDRRLDDLATTLAQVLRLTN